MNYCQTQRKILKEQNPALKNTEISKLLGEEWKNAPQYIRQPHIDREHSEREIYKVEIANWRRNRDHELERQKQHRIDIANQYVQRGGLKLPLSPTQYPAPLLVPLPPTSQATSSSPSSAGAASPLIHVAHSDPYKTLKKPTITQAEQGGLDGSHFSILPPSFAASSSPNYHVGHRGQQKCPKQSPPISSPSAFETATYPQSPYSKLPPPTMPQQSHLSGSPSSMIVPINLKNATGVTVPSSTLPPLLPLRRGSSNEHDDDGMAGNIDSKMKIPPLLSSGSVPTRAASTIDDSKDDPFILLSMASQTANPAPIQDVQPERRSCDDVVARADLGQDKTFYYPFPVERKMKEEEDEEDNDEESYQLLKDLQGCSSTTFTMGKWLLATLN